MRRLAAFLCVAFAFVFFADAKKFKYSVVTESESGEGNHEVISTVNYDLDKREFVTAEDVTGLSTRDLAKLCASYLTSAYGGQKGRAVVDRTNKGDFPLFVLRNGTVTVFFNPYEIASGAEGVLEARIQRWQYEDVGK